ncbi:hypothetical protein BH23BAC1_BH23BAC1_25420 [soil metagenome]
MKIQENQLFATRYLLIKKIGIGGFAEVWEAQDQYISGEPVALKIYTTDRKLDKETIARFSEEYSLTKSLRHSNLIEVIYYDIFNDIPYLVMPLYQNGSLAQLLNIQLELSQPFTETQVATLILQISEALDYLHNQDPPVLHRDIKPENILLSKDNRYLLSDFGISRRVRNTIAINTGKLSDDSMSLAYAAPEKFSRKPSTTASSDIFSFGVMLYQVCSGYLPWEEIGGIALLKGAEIPDIPQIYSRKLNQVVSSCLNVDPAERPTAAQLKEWAEQFLLKGYWNLGGKEKYERKGILIPALITVFIICSAFGAFFFFYNNNITLPASHLVYEADKSLDIHSKDLITEEVKELQIVRNPAHGTLHRQDEISLIYLPGRENKGQLDSIDILLIGQNFKKYEARLFLTAADKEPEPVIVKLPKATLTFDRKGASINSNLFTSENIKSIDIIKEPVYGAVTRFDNQTFNYKPKRGFKKDSLEVVMYGPDDKKYEAWMILEERKYTGNLQPKSKEPDKTAAPEKTPAPDKTVEPDHTFVENNINPEQEHIPDEKPEAEEVKQSLHEIYNKLKQEMENKK